MIVHPCQFDGPDHEYPDDWIFGGANGLHPGADPRFKPTTYEYYDDKVAVVCLTQVPLCDDQALDEFTKVAGRGFNPVWLSAKRPDGKIEMLPWTYDKAEDMLYPKEVVHK